MAGANGRDIESEVSGDLEVVGSPLIRELTEVFRRHGFDAGFVYSAFALDGERWRHDTGIVLDDSFPEYERGFIVQESIELIQLSAEDLNTGEDND